MTKQSRNKRKWQKCINVLLKLAETDAHKKWILKHNHFIVIDHPDLFKKPKETRLIKYL